jgi:hypothetical protein
MARPSRHLAAVLLVPLLSGLGACSHMRGPDPQGVVDQKLVGTPVGDFFERHGAPRSRTLGADGRHSFDWESGFEGVGNGPRAGAGLHCQLHITSAPNGRIVAATIVSDMPGQRHLSYCLDLLD